MDSHLYLHWLPPEHLDPSCTSAVMAQLNEPASTAADPPSSCNNSPQVATAKSTRHQFKNTHLWMDYIQPIWWVQTLSWAQGELIPSSGNMRLTWWQRYPPGIHIKFLQYHWPPEMEPVDTCQCDHRWYCSYQEEKCENLPGSLSIWNGPYCASIMPHIPIGMCANQAWRDPRWTG